MSDRVTLSGTSPPCIRRLSNETLVFDRNSGHTHLLAEHAGTVLRCVAAGAMTRTALDSVLASTLSVPTDEAAAYVDDAVAALQELGILEVVAAS